MIRSATERRLSELGLTLPDLAPTHEFLAVKTTDNQCFVSGHAPYSDGRFQFIGKVGADLDIDTGRQAAELATLGCLASLKAHLGDLDRIRSVLKLNGYVNCDPQFADLPTVTDAASDLLAAIFGDGGRHARTTVGVASLPQNVAVEVEMTVMIAPGDEAG